MKDRKSILSAYKEDVFRDIAYVPVVRNDGVVVWDIYVGGKWVGSRRTFEQARDEAWGR